MASDLGWKEVTGVQMLSRVMGNHCQRNHLCHLCKESDGPMLKKSMIDCILKTHQKEPHLDCEVESGLLVSSLTLNLMHSPHSIKVSSIIIHNLYTYFKYFTACSVLVPPTCRAAHQCKRHAISVFCEGPSVEQ